MTRPPLSPEHLETIRELANAPDRAEAEVVEITLRAALAETVAEIDRVRAPSVVDSLAAMTRALDCLVAEFLVRHPRTLPGDVSVLALLEWNGDRLREAGLEPSSTPVRLWDALGRRAAAVGAAEAGAFDDELTPVDDAPTGDGGCECPAAHECAPSRRAAGPVEIELARRIGSERRARGHDYLWVEPLGDGRAISLLPWGAGGVQLSIGRLGSGFHDDTWVYTGELAPRAWRAALTWNGSGEPEGWYRHPASGRRRQGGDPAKETTR